MADKKEMPVSGGGLGKGEPDGVSGTADTGERGRVNGRRAGGESGGGAYPDPHSGNEPEASGLPAHGGQSDNAYYGGDNPNATTGSGAPAKADGQGARPPAPPARVPHLLRAGGATVEVVEDSGIAAAEATGKIATDAPNGQEPETPSRG